MNLLARLGTGRWSARLVLVTALLVSGALFALLPTSSTETAPSAAAPASAESSEVTTLLEQFPATDGSAAFLVFSRPDGDSRAALSAADRTAIEARVPALAAESTTPQAVAARFSDDGTVGLVVVPVTATDDTEAVAAQADALRTAASDGLPEGVEAQLTGPAGFVADTLNAFAGADTRLLLITAGVVALLLIVTYRSPVLWLVPLTVVAVADGLARFVVGAIAAETGLAADASILGILSVLVFGAGTNYALLLIARYREELLRQEDHRAAMRTAVRGAGPAILASGGTVVASLLMLVFASLAGNRALGIACAIGIALALVFALVVLPPALVLCGRRLFWPFVPRVDAERDRAAGMGSFWARVGGAVSRRPVVVIAASLALVGFLGTGLLGTRVGLTQTEQFVGDPESVQAERTLVAAFDPGSSQTVVLAPDAVAADAATLAEGVDGVRSVQVGTSAAGYTRIDVTLDGEAESEEDFAAIDALRSDYAASDGALSETLVGGAEAVALDADRAAAADRLLVIPLVLGVVLLILILLLRALVAPLLLIASVVATFFASLGAGDLLFRTVFGFPALDTSVVLFSFLFLVALGVDYNIFLTTRAREERARLGAAAGMREALTRTGGVITSAGVLLAAVFVVLGVLPVVALAQVGTIVCIGVLLDTIVIRTLLVPALAFLLGERFWWPARPVVTAERAAWDEPARV